MQASPDSWRYRAKQLGWALQARPLTAVAAAQVAAHLSPAELALFNKFQLSEQWHSYRVMHTLQTAGHNHPPLLTAALLHDIGKICHPLSLFERIFIVLAQKVWPTRLEGWGDGVARGWRRPFVIKKQHPAWGADLVAQAGGDALVVWLIAHHQESVMGLSGPADGMNWLPLLQWADNQH